jgi:hypothetical protein
MRRTRHAWQAFTDALELNPIEILGASRVDPFSSYPVEWPDRALHEALDHGKSPELHVLPFVTALWVQTLTSFRT